MMMIMLVVVLVEWQTIFDAVTTIQYNTIQYNTFTIIMSFFIVVTAVCSSNLKHFHYFHSEEKERERLRVQT